MNFPCEEICVNEFVLEFSTHSGPALIYAEGASRPPPSCCSTWSLQSCTWFMLIRHLSAILGIRGGACAAPRRSTPLTAHRPASQLSRFTHQNNTTHTGRQSRPTASLASASHPSDPMASSPPAVNPLVDYRVRAPPLRTASRPPAELTAGPPIWSTAGLLTAPHPLAGHSAHYRP